MKRRRFYINPHRRLIMQARFTARYIHDANVRRIAAREADRIPETLIEKHRSKKGDMAKLARRIMRSLTDMNTPEQFEEARHILMCCADVMDSTFLIVSETWLGQRRRRFDEYAAA
jgi:hypothetical protein